VNPPTIAHLSFWSLPVGGVQQTSGNIDFCPEKASSHRDLIRLEKTMIDGVMFVLGYNHNGRCVSIRHWSG